MSMWQHFLANLVGPHSRKNSYFEKPTIKLGSKCEVQTKSQEEFLQTRCILQAKVIFNLTSCQHPLMDS